MKYVAALTALGLMAAPAMAACETPAYQDHGGGRLASATLAPMSALLAVVSLPAAGVGVLAHATGHHNAGDNLIGGTADTLCYTGGFASHAIVGRRN
jgi:hypothetical protein